MKKNHRKKILSEVNSFFSRRTWRRTWRVQFFGSVWEFGASFPFIWSFQPVQLFWYFRISLEIMTTNQLLIPVPRRTSSKSLFTAKKYYDVTLWRRSSPGDKCGFNSARSRFYSGLKSADLHPGDKPVRFFILGLSLQCYKTFLRGEI